MIASCRLRGTLPFQALAPELITRKTIKGDFQVCDAHWQNVSPEAIDLVEKLLETKPADRISLIECLVHPWLTVADLYLRTDRLCFLMKELIGLQKKCPVLQKALTTKDSRISRVRNQNQISLMAKMLLLECKLTSKA